MNKKGHSKKTSVRPLGELEMEIMKVLWQRGDATGKEVWETIKVSRKAALTTVLTVMERLSKKGLIKKTKEEGLFVYRPLLTAEGFTKEATRKMLKDYMQVSSASLIASFLDTLEETDPEAIDRLAEFIEKKKREVE